MLKQTQMTNLLSFFSILFPFPFFDPVLLKSAMKKKKEKKKKRRGANSFLFFFFLFLLSFLFSFPTQKEWIYSTGDS